jgi:hypothetical protein
MEKGTHMNSKNMYDALDEPVEDSSWTTVEKKKKKPRKPRSEYSSERSHGKPMVDSRSPALDVVDSKDTVLLKSIDGSTQSVKIMMEKESPEMLIPLPQKWTMWAHSIKNRNWTIDSYYNLFTISTIQDFWRIFNNLQYLGFWNWHLYFMSEGIYPLWEDPHNRDGGIFSFKIELTKTPEILTDLAICLVTNNMHSKDPNEITGISISPKNMSAIIKLWTRTNNDPIKYLPKSIMDKYGDCSTKYTPNIPEY